MSHSELLEHEWLNTTEVATTSLERGEISDALRFHLVAVDFAESLLGHVQRGTCPAEIPARRMYLSSCHSLGAIHAETGSLRESEEWFLRGLSHVGSGRLRDNAILPTGCASRLGRKWILATILSSVRSGLALSPSLFKSPKS